MKTQNDKATPRPWATDIEVQTFDGAILDATIYVNHGSGKGGEICTFRHDPDDGLDNRSEEQIHNARLIVHAVNEYDALCAVAEAADKLLGHQCGKPSGRASKLRIALATLSAIRSQS